MNQSDYPFSFENEFVGNPERLEEKYSEFLKKYDANGLKNMNTMVFGGGKIGDSTVMYKGYLNEAFTSSREEILKKLAINTVFQDTDYFMLWVYYREQAEPASLPNSLQCSILVRKSGSEYKVIAFVYE